MSTPVHSANLQLPRSMDSIRYAGRLGVDDLLLVVEDWVEFRI